MNKTFFSMFLLLLCACSNKPGLLCRKFPQNAIQNEMEQAVASSASFQYGPWIAEDWWNLFHDCQLEAFIQQAYRQNPTLGIAINRVLIAEQLAEAQKAPLLPWVFLEADSLKAKISKTGVFENIPPTLFPFSFRQTQNLLSFSYLIDWWGKYRSAFKASLGDMQAAIAESAEAKLLISIKVAEAYYRYQVGINRLAIANESVKNRENLLALSTDKLNNGLDTDFSIMRLQQSLHKAKEFLYSLEQNVASAKYTLLALLSGNFEEKILPVQIEDLGDTAFSLPPQLPLNLIAHRPEIVAQLWRIEAASHRIHVAHTNFYPNLDLIGLFGFQTIHLKELWNDPSRTMLWGPAMQLPIFQGGLLTAVLKEKEFEYALAVNQYEQLVDKAVEEVLDSISAVKTSAQMWSEVKNIQDISHDMMTLAQKKLDYNIASELEVLQLEKDWLEAQDAAIMAKGQQIFSLLALIKSLGGGYDIEQLDEKEGNCD